MPAKIMVVTRGVPASLVQTPENTATPAGGSISSPLANM